MQCLHICESWRTNRGKLQADISLICKGILVQSFSCKKLSTKKHMANIVHKTRRTTLCWIRGKIKQLLFIKVTWYFPFSFSQKNLNKERYKSTKISYQFLALRVPVLRRNKATNSSTSTDPSSAATKTLVLGNNLFKSERFAITSARAFCHWE